MGEHVEFPSNGSTAQGYLATPEKGSGPGVVVIQEWWGLVDHIRDVCDRFAKAGFVALAPDLYHGKQVATEPDEAGKEMMALTMDQAAKDMSGAVDEVARRAGATPWASSAFAWAADSRWCSRACAPTRSPPSCRVYGIIPWPDAQPDYSKMAAALEGHYAELDTYFTPDAAAALGEQFTRAWARRPSSSCTPAQTTPSSTTTAPRSTTPQRPRSCGPRRWPSSTATWTRPPEPPGSLLGRRIVPLGRWGSGVLLPPVGVRRPRRAPCGLGAAAARRPTPLVVAPAAHDEEVAEQHQSPRTR